MICNAELCLNYFSVNVSIRAIVFRWQIKKKKMTILPEIVGFFENCRRNTRASTETFTENSLQPKFALHFTSYLSIALSKILPNSKNKKKKNAKKLLVFCENDSCRLSKFLQTHIFWNFDYISRIYNQLITGIFDFQK